MLDVCYKSSAILHVDIAKTSDSFEGKRSELPTNNRLLMRNAIQLCMAANNILHMRKGNCAFLLLAIALA